MGLKARFGWVTVRERAAIRDSRQPNRIDVGVYDGRHQLTQQNEEPVVVDPLRDRILYFVQWPPQVLARHVPSQTILAVEAP